MLMYNAVIPDHDSGDNSSNRSGSNGDSISLFDIGERLMTGKGV